MTRSINHSLNRSITHSLSHSLSQSSKQSLILSNTLSLNDISESIHDNMTDKGSEQVWKSGRGCSKTTAIENGSMRLLLGWLAIQLKRDVGENWLLSRSRRYRVRCMIFSKKASAFSIVSVTGYRPRT